jgi:hypothetical protein
MELRDPRNVPRAGMVSAEDVEDVQPLMLDKMFERVFAWGMARSAHSTAKMVQESASGSNTPIRVNTTTSTGPEEDLQTNSPLGALFDYPELTPHILKWFERPCELAVLVRVNSTFRDIARKKLYHHIWIRPCELPPNLPQWLCPVLIDS